VSCAASVCRSNSACEVKIPLGYCTDGKANRSAQFSACGKQRPLGACLSSVRCDFPSARDGSRFPFDHFPGIIRSWMGRCGKVSFGAAVPAGIYSPCRGCAVGSVAAPDASSIHFHACHNEGEPGLSLRQRLSAASPLHQRSLSQFAGQPFSCRPLHIRATSDTVGGQGTPFKSGTPMRRVSQRAMDG
jgi:hypothetical protein